MLISLPIFSGPSIDDLDNDNLYSTRPCVFLSSNDKQFIYHAFIL